MKKYIVLLVLPLLLAWDFPTHSNTATCDVTKVTGKWDSFNWFWVASDTQTVSIDFKNGSDYIDMTGDRVGFRLGRYCPTGLVTTFDNTNITVSVSNVSVTVATTNMPSKGDNYCEVYIWDSSISKTRTLAQGRIIVSTSLFP